MRKYTAHTHTATIAALTVFCMLLPVNTCAFQWVQIDVGSISPACTSTETYDLSGTDLNDIWGSGSSNIYAIGDVGPTGAGTVLHYTGREWRLADFSPDKADRDLQTIWGADGDNVFIGARQNRTVYYFNGSGWEKVSSNNLSGKGIYDLWGVSVNKIWAPGNLFIGSFLIATYYYNMQYLDIDNSNVNKAESDPPTMFNIDLYGVWGSSEQNVYAVGEYGCKKNTLMLCQSGTHTNIIHTTGWKEGYDWTAVETGSTETLYGIWGSAADDIFAVGEFGTILHYDGTSWSTMDSPTGNNLNAVWGSAAGDVYAVGNSGTILHHDGSSWAAMPSSTGSDLNSVWGSSADTVFIAGSSGTLLKGEPLCGDGTLDPGEQCEIDTDCPAGQFCQGCQCVQPVCGNGIVEGAEECESDADCPAGRYCDGCTCVEPECGNGVIEPGETCESDADCPSGQCQDCTCQTLVTISDLNASPGNRKVVLTWATASEVDSAGFNIYRSKNKGGYTQINSGLIPARGSQTAGARYRYIDTGVKNRTRYSYIIEDIDIFGEAVSHGPVSATPGLVVNPGLFGAEQ